MSMTQTWDIDILKKTILACFWILFKEMCWGYATIFEFVCYEIIAPASFDWFRCLLNPLYQWNIQPHSLRSDKFWINNSHTLNLRSTTSPVYGSLPVIGGSAYGTPLNAWYFWWNELVTTIPSIGPLAVCLTTVGPQYTISACKISNTGTQILLCISVTKTSLLNVHNRHFCA